MKDAVVVTILSSLPPIPSPTPQHHHHNNHSTTITTTKPKPTPKHRPKPAKLACHPPLLSTVTSRRRNGTDGVKYSAELASKLAEDGRFEDFLMIAESVVVASGARASQFAALLDLRLVAIGIVRVIREGRVSSLFETLNGVRKLGFGVRGLFDGVAMEELQGECRRIMRRGDVEQVVSFMETLHGFSFSIKELVEPSEVIKLCVNKRNPSAAIRFARIFPHVQVLFCTIMLEFGKKGDLGAALTVFESSKQNLGSPNMYAYRTIIDVCGLCGNYLKSRSIYEELACKYIPNAHVFNSLMNVNACDLSYTLHLYKQMRKLGVPADIATYNILLKSCCLAGRVDLARGIYRKVRHLEMTGALKLDVFTYSTIIKVFADAKLWQMALKVKEDMLIAGVTPNTVTWASLISACANAGLVERAIHLFEEMLHAGCRPNAQCCNILLHACVEACQYDRAFRLFYSWKENGFHRAESEAYGNQIDSSNLSLNHVGENCATCIPDQISSSRHSYLPLKVPFTPTNSTYNTLMKACGTDFFRAKALMDEMKTVGLSPNHISWSILIDICGGSGNMDGALLILRSMRESGIQPDVITYTTVIKVCVESKNLKIAFSLFAEMKRNQIKPNMVTYNTLLRARSKYGSLQEVRQCLAIYQDMRKAGYNSNDYYLKRLIEEWCEEVIQISDQNKVPSYVDSTNLRAQSLLLEKVAEHLHKSDADSISIDLQGLSKVEARIVVLAVLRMIKEKYTQGNAIKDDMQIILGVQNDSTNADENGAEAAVIRLLQNDMGLEVLKHGSSIKNDRHSYLESSDDSDLDFEVLEKSRLPRQLESSTRRPAVLKRLKVSKDSLYHWLQKRIGVSAG